MNILDEITTDKGTFRVRLEQDDDPLHPRVDYDHAATMVLSHRRHNLPHEGELTGEIDDAFDLGGYKQAAEYLVGNGHAAAVLPVWGYDHGQLTIKAGERDYPFNDRWDSGLAGLIYITPEAAREAFGDYTAQQLDDLLRAEVAEYDQYLTGDVWGYVVERLIPECEHCGCEQRHWEVEKSCWGLYGYDYAEKQARSVLSAVARTECPPTT